MNISTVGVSLIFLPNGQVIDQLPIFEPGVMIQTVPLRDSITPAMAIGEFFDFTVNTVALGLMISGFGLSRSRREKK